MKDKVYIIAVVVIVCLIFWRKSLVEKKDKPIEGAKKANNSKKEEVNKLSETKLN